MSDGIFYRFEALLSKFYRRGGRIASVGHGLSGPALWTHYTLRLKRKNPLPGQVAFHLHTIKAETLSMMEVCKPGAFSIDLSKIPVNDGMGWVGPIYRLRRADASGSASR